MTTMQALTQLRTKPGRRTALTLLAALAVTLGAVAAPLAGTAHADGPPAGPVTPAGGRIGGVLNTGTAPRPTTAHPGGAQPVGTVSPAGTSKPSANGGGL